MILFQFLPACTCAIADGRYRTGMSQPIRMPNDLASCHKLIAEQSEGIAAQQEKIVLQERKIDELNNEMDKLRKLISKLINGNRSEKRIPSDENQLLLPFETEEELQIAQAEAEAEAETIIQEYTVKREIRKKQPRDESLPSHLPRVEKIVDVSDDMKNCPEHGQRKMIGYDVTETLKREPARLWVEVNKYAKYACSDAASCGITSPERPTSLVEGNRYDTSIAAAVIEAKWAIYLPIYRQQDIFASSGWTPSRSTLLNLISQSQFVLQPLVECMTKLVQQDVGIGFDETSCRMLLPRDGVKIVDGDAKSIRLAQKVAEARRKGQKSLLGKMWVYSGLHDSQYNIFDFRVSRHRDGPDEFLKTSHCKVQGDCFSGNLSVVLDSDERLEFVACWSHARRKVEAATTYVDDADLLLMMIRALYDIETRAKEMSWEERGAIRERESTIVLAGMKKWLESPAINDLLPKSDFAEAVRYIRNHWVALNAYVTDGRIPIDNNCVE